MKYAAIATDGNPPNTGHQKHWRVHPARECVIGPRSYLRPVQIDSCATQILQIMLWGYLAITFPEMTAGLAASFRHSSMAGSHTEGKAPCWLPSVSGVPTETVKGGGFLPPSACAEAKGDGFLPPSTCAGVRGGGFLPPSLCQKLKVVGFCPLKIVSVDGRQNPRPEG